MTEAPTETKVLLRNGIYSHNGVYRIAIMDYILQDLTGTDTFQVNPGEVTLVEAPGTAEWVDRMARTRSVLNRRADDFENNLRMKNEYIETLGQALLEEAERRDWCSEYDDFAQEWDLPTRSHNYTVTVTVQVEARNADAAADLVRENVDLVLVAYSTDGVLADPEISVEEAY